MVHGVRWREDIGIVAILADGCRGDMHRMLACSIGAIVAARAVPCDIHMVEIRRCPPGRGVTVVAIGTAIHMGRVLARRRDSVMTGTASAHYLRMVNRKHGCPHVRVMAVLAHVAGLNMGRVLACCLHPVVTANAITCNIYVVEIRR